MSVLRSGDVQLHTVDMKPLLLAVWCSLCLTAHAQTVPAPAAESDLYSVTSDQVVNDPESDTTAYMGNARVVVANLFIEADSITIARRDGLPSRITASGSPIRFGERVPKQNINGTAREMVFDVPELKLSLVDYSIVDPSGNTMKGKKASFVLSP